MEDVGAVERLGVVVGRAEHSHHGLVLLEVHAVEVDGLGRDAHRQLDGGVPAQQLLDCVLGDTGVEAEPRQLIGVTKQRDEAVADQVRGRLVARGQEERERTLQLLRGETLPLLLGLDERGQEVIGRLLAALLGEPGHVAVEFVDRLPQHLGAGGGERVEKAHQMVRPALEGREVARRDAEHLSDNRHRERHREVANDVELAAAGERRQQAVGQLLDARTELLERPWGERLRHELPEPRVVGRIATQHRGLVGLIRVGEPVGDLPRALLGVAGVVPIVGGEPTVAQDGEAVGMAEEEPAADGTAAVNRVALAEAPVKWIRPFACLTEEGVEERVEDVPVSTRSATMALPMRASSRPMRSDRASVLTWRSLYPGPGAAGNVSCRQLPFSDRRSAGPREPTRWSGKNHPGAGPICAA